MDNSLGNWQIGGLVGLMTISLLYIQGWRNLRRATPLASTLRLAAFGVGMAVLVVALVWPLPGWSNSLLAMRSLQKVLICMVAAPLLWLATPLHVLAWAGGRSTRRAFVLLQRELRRKGSFLHSATRPLVLWFLYLGAFLFWHDPQAVPFLVGDGWGHDVAPWLLLGTALLFWWPVVDTGPRRNLRLSPWVLLSYLLGVEIANMIAGVTVAFSVEPIYAYYPALRATLPPGTLPLTQLEDQMIGGALVWVFGSLAYIAAIILVLNRLFHRDGATAPQPLAGWDAHDKFIAPGLEERAAYNQLHNVDLTHR